MKRIHDVIRRPMVTEKSTSLRESENQVVFEVDRKANKQEIREAVERLFGVKVERVNTMQMPGKARRFGRVIGRRGAWKRAVVQLAEGQQIDFYETSEDLGEAEA